MKKLISILIVLVTVTSFITVGANTESKVGKQITSEVDVYVNGVKVKNAMVIDNTSYLPVRSVAETLGAEVDFKGGVVLIDSEMEQLLLEKEERAKKNQKLYSLKSEIEMIDIRIARNETTIEKINEKIIKDGETLGTQALYNEITKIEQSIEDDIQLRKEKEQELLNLL